MVGASQLELEPLGLDKIDFMQGSMIWGEEDENTTSCLVWGEGEWWLKYQINAT